ncbi:MAG: FtsW/RodA/SpoVE family cell cycle protein [Tannerellaceae bacterium]|jgi:cell division protein FtsW|nr:FtsW/RodA/SpoVE family cell cycle protein [Tannerellaceae bacterium]
MGLPGKLFKGDRVIWVIYVTLCLISLIEVFSATSTLVYKHGDYLKPVAEHFSHLLIGLAMILVVHHIPYRFSSSLILLFLLPISILLLAVTLFFGLEINESSRWINLFGIRFQPSELAKLSCVVYVSFLLSRRNEFTEAQIFNAILIGVIVVCSLIFSENFSTCAILFFFCYLMMFIGRISLKRMGGLSLVVIALAVLFFSLLHTFPDDMVNKSGILAKIKHRTENVFKKKPPLDAKTYKIDDYNRQETYAKIAIANGGGVGKLPGHGQQRDTLPQAYSDFIYAIIIEELGVVAGIVVLLLYVVLLIRVGVIARKCNKLFPKLLVLGCGLLIGIQALTNMGVVVGLFPVTGQPLPLVSRGGTSIAITCIYFGIILNISHSGAGMGNEEEEEEEEEEKAAEEEEIKIETDL